MDREAVQHLLQTVNSAQDDDRDGQYAEEGYDHNDPDYVPSDEEGSEALADQLIDRLAKSTRIQGCTCGHGHSGSRARGQTMGLDGLVHRLYTVPDVLQPLAEIGVQGLPPIGIGYGAPDLERILAGARDQPRLDMELSSVPDEDVRVTRRWDIDFSLLFLKSLAAACRPGEAFRFVYQTVYYRRLTQSVHIGIETEGGRMRPLHTVKHMRIGCSSASNGYNIFVAFPNMQQMTSRTGEPSCHLTDREQQEWIDTIVLPCLREAYGDDGWDTHEVDVDEDEAEDGDYSTLLDKILQHHPRSYEEARNRADAPQSTNMSGAACGRKEISYHLPYSRLARFWTLLQETLETMGGGWRGARLFALDYGQKLIMDDISPRLVLQRYKDHLSRSFDTSLIDMEKDVYADLGYEDVAHTVDSRYNVVALRRTACNEADVKQIKVGAPASTVLYNWHGTEQCSNMTIEPRPNGKFAKLGFFYSQMYNCLKDMYFHPTRQAEKMFSQTDLNLLAYQTATLAELHQRRDQAIRPNEKARAVRCHVLANMAKQVLGTQRACKQKATPFSTRQEFRLRLPLLEQLVNRLEEIGAPDHRLRLAEGAHWPFLVLKHDLVVNYMRKNTDRWLLPITAIAYRDVQNNGSPRSVEQQHRDAVTLTVLLECLDQAINDSPVDFRNKFAKESYLIPRRRGVELSEEERSRTGLGIRKSLKDKGMVLLPRDQFDYLSMRILPEAMEVSGYCTDDYRARRRHTATYDSQRQATLAAQRILDRLDEVPDGPGTAVHQQALEDCFEALHQLLIMAYARDVMQHLATKVRPPGLDSLTEEEMQGKHGLNFDMIARQVRERGSPSPPRGKGGQCKVEGFSGRETDMATRIRLLLDPSDQDGYNRKHWSYKDFRKAGHAIHRVIKDRLGDTKAREWCSAIGTGRAATYLTVFAHYEMDKWIGGDINMRWVLASPDLRSLTRDDTAQTAKWELVTQLTEKKEMIEDYKHESQLLRQGVWHSSPMDKLDDI